MGDYRPAKREDAVMHLDKARNCIADYVESPARLVRKR